MGKPLTIEISGPRALDLARLDEGCHARKNPHTHGEANAKLFSVLHSQAFENFPGQEGQQNVHEPRVHSAHNVELYSNLGIQTCACLGNDPVLVDGILFYGLQLASISSSQVDGIKDTYTLKPAKRDACPKEHITGH